MSFTPVHSFRQRGLSRTAFVAADWLDHSIPRAGLPPQFLRELQSLSGERDPEVFFSGLLSLGQRMVQAGQVEGAVPLFQMAATQLSGPAFEALPSRAALHRRAESELQAIVGGGGGGARGEFLLRSLAREACQPIGLGSMAVGGLAFSAVRAGALSRLISAPVSGFLTRGFGARALASGLAFGAEVPAFVFTGRFLKEASGVRQDWSLGAIGRELAANALVLGALKISGAAAASAGERWAFAARHSGVQGLFQQAGMLTGIVAGHRAEEFFGLRSPQGGGDLLVDSLATLVQFNVAGRLLHHAMGPQWSRFQRDLELRSRELGRDSGRGGFDLLDGAYFGLRLVDAGSGRVPRSPLPTSVLMASQGGEGNGGKRPPSPAGPRETLESPGVSPRASSIPPRPSLAALIERMPPGTRIGPRIPVSGGREDGRYEIVRQLGQGGRGKVYEVLDHKSGRVAAIKIPISVDSAEDAARFDKEIWISENLASGWAVTIYDHFELEEGSGISVPVMERVEGRSLIDLLADLDRGVGDIEQAFPLDRRLEFFADLCRGINDAHQHGITHNDLKPGNLMVDRHLRARIFDWGLARHVDDARTEGRTRLSVHALSLKPQTQTATADHSGTIGYFPPELGTKHAHELPLSQDIFSLGVMLFELATLRHPFGKFRKGGAGEPRLIPEWVKMREFDEQGREYEREVHQIDSVKASFYGTNPDYFPPAFADILGPGQPAYLSTLESIALRAMAVRPEDRFPNAAALREAVLMARPRAAYLALADLRAAIAADYESLTDKWLAHRDGVEPPPHVWGELHRPIEKLRQQHRLWEHGVIQALQDLAGVIGSSKDGKSWIDAHRMTADLNWQLLNDQYDHLPARVRAELTEKIRHHDLLFGGGRPTALSRSLTESIPVRMRFLDLATGRDLSAGIELTVVPWNRELGADGLESGNYVAGAPVYSGTVHGSGASLSLPVGYYALKIRAPGYAEAVLPLHLTLQDVRRRLEGERDDISRHVRLAPASRLRPGMRFIPEGEATIGLNIFAGHENLVTSFGFPERRTAISAMAMSEHPITVGEYREMVVDVLRREGPEAAERLIPRIIRSNSARIRPLAKIEPGFLAWTRNLLGRIAGAVGQASKTLLFGWRREPERGYQLFWTIRDRGRWRLGERYELVDPTSHPDPNGDPIFLDQPVSSNTYLMAEAYVQWRARRDGASYRIASIVEMEAVARNFFPWKFSYGNNLDPLLVVSRQAIADKTLTYPQPIGTHPLGAEYFHDTTLFGVQNLMGNVRKFSSTVGEANTVAIFGGSVGAVTGPYYYPSSRNFLVTDRPVPVVGSFYLVEDLSGRPSPP